MDKNFSPSYSLSQITYVEAEAVEFLRFPFHRKRTALTLPLPASASTSLTYMHALKIAFAVQFMFLSCVNNAFYSAPDLDGGGLGPGVVGGSMCRSDI